MKKMFLAALLCAGSFMTANAGYLLFYNMTGCDFVFNINGAIGTTGNFGANNVNIPPGVTNFANPSLLPGVSQYGSGSLASGYVQLVKGYDVGGPSFVIGISPSYPTMSTTYNSASNNYFPVCYNNTAYTANFYQNGNNDVVVIIN